MQLRQLELFLSVAEEKSISAAAKAAYVSAPTLIKQMNALEDDLGYALLSRTNRGVTLTPAGEAFYEDAKEIVARMRAAAAHGREIAHSDARTLRVGASYAKPPILEVFRVYQQSAFASPVEFVNIAPQDKLSALLERRIDLTWIADLPPEDETLSSAPLYSTQLMLMASRNHPLAERASVSFADLHGERLILSRPGTKRYGSALRAFLDSKHPEIELMDLRYTAEDTFVISQGNAVMLTTELQYAENDAICTIPLEDAGWTLPSEVIAIYRKEDETRVRDFVHVMRSVLLRRQEEERQHLSGQ